jgi:transcriptional regulator with XRE-family HTH domain
MNISDVFRAWRHHEEMTLQQAADKIGLPIDTYRRIERGNGMEGYTLATLLRWLMAD